MAQAVATRSYYTAARGRHRGFDFCDTTHCQFLRDPPAPNALAAIATERTRGLVLAYHAILSRRSSRQAAAGARARSRIRRRKNTVLCGGCVYCRRGPRVHCSYCDPHAEGAGHGFGLCQTGAKGMAATGATFREILRRYYRTRRFCCARPPGSSWRFHGRAVRLFAALRDLHSLRNQVLPRVALNQRRHEGDVLILSVNEVTSFGKTATMVAPVMDCPSDTVPLIRPPSRNSTPAT